MNKKFLRACCRTSFVCFTMLLIVVYIQAQNKKAKVLFIGNSYTAVNNLPQLVADVAASTGDTLEYDVSAVGSATFYKHYLELPATTEKIRAGGWDYVVLQEQSQYPATPPTFFGEWCYPFAKRLVDLVRLHNPCAEIIFYMTWGRKNGDRSRCPFAFAWLHFCTYQRMDSVLRSRYLLLADSNKATVSPVGPVWRYLRVNHPNIELYDADESHPSPAGSYAGACSFYTAIFKKPAERITYNYSLSAENAATIRTAASKVVYDSLSFWSIGRYETIAGFNHTADRLLRVSFTNKSVNASRYHWDFGDGQTSTASNPVHNYPSAGIYSARLISSGDSCRDTTYARINITHDPNAGMFTVAPNPATDNLYITSELFGRDNYRIQLLNSMGQLVYDQRASGAATQSIFLSGLARGIYTLNICTTRRVYRKKIIIQ